MKVLLFLCSMVCLPLSGYTSSNVFMNEEIDFTDTDDAAKKATWPKEGEFVIGPDGLGWKGAADTWNPVYFMTEPKAVGVAWRPPTALSMSAEVVLSREGDKGFQQQGRLFVRYSPDRKNWSTWQACHRKENAEDGRTESFETAPMVPATDRAPYEALLRKYSALDVPWGSDEDAAVRWIVSNDPKFFEKHTPFIGYYQFLYEKDLAGTERIKKFKISGGYCVGGMAMTPRDPGVSQSMEPWSYVAE